MPASAFALTSTGLATPRLPEARALIVEKWRQAYGDNAQTSSDSPDGLMIDTLAILFALLWEGNGQVFANSFLRTAEGNAVDLLLDLFSFPRLDASYSTVEGIWYGDPGATIDVDSVATVDDTGARFVVDADTTIGASGLWVVLFPDAVVGYDYTVTVDADPDVVRQGLFGDTADDIRDGMSTLLAAAYPDASFYSATDPDGVPLLIIEGLTGSTIAVDARLSIYNAARVAMTAEETGPTAAAAGTLRDIATPIVDVVGVTSAEDASVGRDRESDAAYKMRWYARRNVNGKATLEAVRARLLDVDDVESVAVFVNRTMTTDADGLPPRSIEAVVLGGDPDDIAAALFATIAAGEQPYGSTSVDVLDSQGRTHTMAFTRPTELYLHLRITVTAGEGYPTTGTPLTTIRDAVATYLSQGGAGELGLGDDLYRFQLGRPINIAVPGVATAVIETATTATAAGSPSWAEADVTVTDRQILRVSADRITVTT